MTFQAVHNHIQFARLQQRLELVCPQGLGVEFVQGRYLVLVAHGRHGVDLVFPLRPCLA